MYTWPLYSDARILQEEATKTQEGDGHEQPSRPATPPRRGTLPRQPSCILCGAVCLQHIEAAPWLCGVQLHALHAVGALRKHFLQAREQSRAGQGQASRGTAVGWRRSGGGSQARLPPLAPRSCCPGWRAGGRRSPSHTRTLMSSRSGCRQAGQEGGKAIARLVRSYAAGRQTRGTAAPASRVTHHGGRRSGRSAAR
jgi:hypothetical protein